MSFNWIAFCDRYKVDYVTAGLDHIEVHCIWCGSEDHSHHLAISLSGKGYKCWIAPQQHKGIKPTKLVQALLGCPWAEAFSITGEETRGPARGDIEFMNRAQELLGTRKSQTPKTELEYLKEFRPLVPEGSGRYFVEYMASRGYSESDLYKLNKRYNLQCTISGFFKYRVIFPIRMDGKLVAWTGRSTNKNADIRYQTLSANADVAEKFGLPKALMSIERTLWNYDVLLKGGEDLYICEGPFDALRLDYTGYKFDIGATCVFKKNISSEQIALLDNIVPRFKRAFLLFDAKEYLDIFRTRSQLVHLELRTKPLPRGFEDPGDMDYKAAARFLEIR